MTRLWHWLRHRHTKTPPSPAAARATYTRDPNLGAAHWGRNAAGRWETHRGWGRDCTECEDNG